MLVPTTPRQSARLFKTACRFVVPGMLALFFALQEGKADPASTPVKGEGLRAALSNLFSAKTRLSAHEASPALPTASETGTAALPLPNARQMRNVIASAFSFTLPRSLAPHTLSQLSVWGLEGLTALDPTLSVKLTKGRLILSKGVTPLTSRTAPDAHDLKGWVAAIMEAFQAAWTQAPLVRQAGDQALLSAFFKEIFSHFDPYSRYLTPLEAHDERAYREGDDYSIGLTLTARPGHAPIVSGININSAAWDKGLDIGQSLLAINGRSTRNVPVDTVQDWLKGAPGTQVVLTFWNGRKKRTISLSRRRLPPETVFPDRQGPYIVLRITHFSSQTAEEVSFYLSNLLPEAPSQNNSDSTLDGTDDQTLAEGKNRIPGLILDLRGNRGGTLQQAVVTAALLLNGGIAATTEGRDPLSNHIWAVQGGDLISGSPIAVVVDGATASAAEVLAAALADHRRAAVVGSSTFGKGLVQVIGQMPNKGEIFITWSRNFAPLGWPIQGLGVLPQLCASSAALTPTAQLTALAHGRSLMGEALLASRRTRVTTPLNEILAIRSTCPAVSALKIVSGKSSSGSERHESNDDIKLAARLLSSARAYRAALDSIPDDQPQPVPSSP